MEFIEYTWQSMKLSGPLMVTTPKTVGATSEAVSTRDAATDRRLEILVDNAEEPLASALHEDLPSISDRSYSEEIVENGKGAICGTDDHENDVNEEMNGTSDHDDSESESNGDSEQDATQNSHVDGMSDQIAVQYGRSNDLSSSKKRKSPNGPEVFDVGVKVDVMQAISAKERKAKRTSEGFKVKKKTTLKIPQQRTMKRKTRAGLDVKSQRKGKLKTKTT